jgi:hypothetical protein
MRIIKGKRREMIKKGNRYNEYNKKVLKKEKKK